MFHRRLLLLLRDVRGPILACTLAGLVVSATYVAQALLLAAALTHVAAGRYAEALVDFARAGAVVLVRCLVLCARSVLISWCGGIVRTRLRDRLLHHLADLGPGFVTGARAGAVRGLLVDGVDSLDPYYSRYVPQVLVTAAVPAVLVGWLYTVHLPAAVVLTIGVGLVLVVPRFKDATLLRTGKHRWEAYLEIAADYLEAVQGLPTLRAFGAAGRRRDQLQTRSDRLYRESMRELRVSLTENGFSAFVVLAGTAAAVLITAATLWPSASAAVTQVEPRTGISVVFLVLLVSVECFRPVRDLTAAWHAGYLGLTVVDGLDLLLGATPQVRDTGTADVSWRVGDPPAIDLVDVTYTYPEADRPALAGLTLHIPAGSTVAIVGPSGAGKSTLAALLWRAADPTRGSIRFDGHDLPSLRLRQVRRSVASVSQRPWLMAASVADNLRLGAAGAGAEELHRAARLCAVDSVIDALPAGYDTILAEDGGSLSGGERQRLALARAVLRQTPVLVLDEVTAHLDTGTEADVLGSLRRVRAGRTGIVIAHRLSTVRDADLVVVLDEGRLVQQGRFAELAGSPRPFRELLADGQTGLQSNVASAGVPG